MFKTISRANSCTLLALAASAAASVVWPVVDAPKPAHVQPVLTSTLVFCTTMHDANACKLGSCENFAAQCASGPGLSTRCNTFGSGPACLGMSSMFHAIDAVAKHEHQEGQEDSHGRDLAQNVRAACAAGHRAAGQQMAAAQHPKQPAIEMQDAMKSAALKCMAWISRAGLCMPQYLSFRGEAPSSTVKSEYR